MPDGLRFEQSQRLQRQEAGHENRVEEHPAHQLPIQPPFQCQRGDGRGQTAAISGQQTDRQPLQGHAPGEQRLERKKRRQRLQKGEAELQEPVQTVEAWLPQEIREQLRQRQARDLQNTAHPTSALHERRTPCDWFFIVCNGRFAVADPCAAAETGRVQLGVLRQRAAGEPASASSRSRRIAKPVPITRADRPTASLARFRK